MVPAVTISPSSNFIRAKFLASVSVSNVLVDRGLRLRTNVPLLGISKVTYQVCFIFDPDGSHHHAFPAIAPPSLTRRRRPARPDVTSDSRQGGLACRPQR